MATWFERNAYDENPFEPGTQEYEDNINAAAEFACLHTADDLMYISAQEMEERYNAEEAARHPSPRDFFAGVPGYDVDEDGEPLELPF